MNKTLREFFTKYPYADRTKLITDSVFGQSEPGVFFGPTDDNSYIYTGDSDFKNNKKYTKYLTINKPPPTFPKIWLGGGTVQKVQGKRHHGGAYPYLTDNVIDHDIYNLKIYVNHEDFFIAKLPTISAGDRTNIADEWRGGESYYKLIFAVYLSSYCCGIGAEHLKFSEHIYPVITSIMRFHLYFMVRRILRRLEFESESSLMREFGVGKYNDVIGNMANIPRWDRRIAVPRSGYGHGFY